MDFYENNLAVKFFFLSLKVNLLKSAFSIWKALKYSLYELLKSALWQNEVTEKGAGCHFIGLK